MIMAVDIGNTNIKIGIFDNDELVKSFKMSTIVNRTSDEYVAILTQLLIHNKISLENITGAIVSSVIPQLDYTFCNVITYCFGIKPLVLGVGVKTGLHIKYDSPRELGSDRIATCVAAMNEIGTPVIVVDFGTATTVNVVNEKHEFLGGCITLGIKSASDALSRQTAKLPNVELYTPSKVVAQSTSKAIQSGIIYGTVGQIKYILEKVKQETGLVNAKVVATGGMSELVSGVENIFDCTDRALSLKGLYRIYKLNSDKLQ